MVTVAQAAENYLDWFRVHRRSVAETEAVINTHILPWFAHREVESLTTKELKQWRDGLAATPRRKKGRKGAVLCEPPKTPDERRARKNTTNRILTVFKAILNKAFEEDDCSSDLAWRKVRPFKNVDLPATLFLTVEESVRLIDACPADFRALVRAALFTGGRYSELARLRPMDIDLANGMAYISPEAKSGKSRFIYLNDAGKPFLAEAMKGRPRNAPIFVKASGTRWGRGQHVRRFRSAMAAANIHLEISFRDLRHTLRSSPRQRGM